MNNEIAKVEKLTWLSNEEKVIIRKQFFPQNASDIEMKYCMSVAEKFNLNPILKQIFFIARKSKTDNGQWIEKIEPLAGRDSFLTLAHRSGKFAGIETSTEIKPTAKLINGEWEQKNDLVAICKVYRSDMERPVIVEVSYSEYVQKNGQGEITKFWREKPETMLKKVAESQALRKAFDITGLYAEEEIREVQVESTRSNQQLPQKQSDTFSESVYESEVITEVKLDEID
jgi:phage recombination protein Bet